MGRPRRKKKIIVVTYNISVETRDQLDKLKQERENQNDVVQRLIDENEAFKEELADYAELLRDSGETMIALRKNNAILEAKLKEKNQMDVLSVFPNVF